MLDDLTASPKTTDAGRLRNGDQVASAPQVLRDDLSLVSLDQKLDQALRTGPRPAVPADFAARVISRLPLSSTAAPASRVPSPSTMLYAQRAMMLCLLLLLLALLFTAPHLANGSRQAPAIEWTISAEVALIAVYLGRWHAPWTYRVR